MEPFEINLISNTIPFDDAYANMWRPAPELKFLKNLQTFNGISVFVDDLIPQVDSVDSPLKIAWLAEPPVIKPAPYQWMLKKEYREKFDYILSFSEEVVSIDDGKGILLPYGACWITERNSKIYEKSKMLSIVASNKNYAPGHQLRHQVIKNIDPGWEIHGSGYNFFPHTEEGRLIPFKDYRYSVVIENCNLPNYFTDKLIDCFATGTIPIFWGLPNIEEYFNMDGILVFHNQKELEDALANISEEAYNSRMDAIKDNFSRVSKWDSPDRNLLNIILEITI